MKVRQTERACYLLQDPVCCEGGRLRNVLTELPPPEAAMAGHQKDPLRHLTPDEQNHREHLSRSRTDPAAQVANRSGTPRRSRGHSTGSVPDRDTDGTATWSLPTLQRVLGRASDGLPTVSTYCASHMPTRHDL